MKHKHAGRILGREISQRKALFKTLLGSLVLHERITTTEAKAKEINNFIDRIINKAKAGKMAAPRRVAVIRELRNLLPEVAVKKLFGDFSARFDGRENGYARVVKIGERKSDSAKMAVIEFV